MGAFQSAFKLTIKTSNAHVKKYMSTVLKFYTANWMLFNFNLKFNVVVLCFNRVFAIKTKDYCDFSEQAFSQFIVCMVVFQLKTERVWVKRIQ